MPAPNEALAVGQSIWLDYLRRFFLTSGEFLRWREQGITGMMSNPTVFERTIAGSADYDEDLRKLTRSGVSSEEIRRELLIGDVRLAAEHLLPVHKDSRGTDGYVSVGVPPSFLSEPQALVRAARSLFESIARPNVLIALPATPPGLEAGETLVAAGVPVNFTLVFSPDHYEGATQAYFNGLEKRAESGGDPAEVFSVVSVPVGEVDAFLDPVLKRQGAVHLAGRLGVANAARLYRRFREILASDRWKRLAALGAKIQRLLWMDTASKNPLDPDTRYADELVGPDTIAALPLETFYAFLDHGSVAPRIQDDPSRAETLWNELGELGISFESALRRLQERGAAALVASHEAVLRSIEEKGRRLQKKETRGEAHPGGYRECVDRGIVEVREHRIMERIWAHDHTVWKPDPKEIRNRLGWLHIAEGMRSCIQDLRDFTEELRKEGYTRALLMGMGGSSLAPQVFQRTFGPRKGFLNLHVLDSTDPAAVLAMDSALDPRETLFIVSTKSGGTVETLSFFKYFYNRTVERLGEEEAGRHFAAVTDPGSSLEELADRYRFRAVFLNDPTIGGRYSALSYFGLLPAALLGIDLEALLHRALSTAYNTHGCNCPMKGDNWGARLGVLLGDLAGEGRDKVTFFISPRIAALGDWIEQLIAESTGKEGKGILPVVGEPPGSPSVYGKDRLFVSLLLPDDPYGEDTIRSLEQAGHPWVGFRLHDLLDLGGQFFLWEMATAVAGSRMHINPFDQPNVEAAKISARRMIEAYRKEGSLPQPDPTLCADGIQVYGETSRRRPHQALLDFVRSGEPGAYIALQAYVRPSSRMDSALRALRIELRDRTRFPVTTGYGPRFLHSTGQLHKGDGGKGLFVQFTSDNVQDASIPDEAGSPQSSVTFGILKMAQALGDRQALENANRRVIRFHLGENPEEALERLIAHLRSE